VPRRASFVVRARQLMFIAVLASAFALLLAGSSPVDANAAAPGPVLIPDCSNAYYGGKVTPPDWSTGCLGGSVNLYELSWSGWGGPAAVANGIVRHNDCEPSCADGSIYPYPVQLQASNPRECASPLGRRSYYSRFAITAYLPEDNVFGEPAGPKAFGTFDAICPDPGYRVATGGKVAAFGAFEETSGEGAGDRLSSVFGPPSSKRRSRYACTLRWPHLGMAVRVQTYGGLIKGDPCENGTLNYASLSSSRWRTMRDIGPGVRASKARKARVGRCSRRTYCGVKRGFILGKHQNDCASQKVPSVVAEIRGGRVRRLLVYTHGCE